MAVAVSYPGVYVQEVPSGVRSIAGVSTSITMFIGRTVRGPINQPVRLTSFADFDRAFANDSSAGDMARYVKLFFTNGGTDCYVMRVAEGATTASMTMLAEDGGTTILTLTSTQPGAIGNDIRARVTYPATDAEGVFNIEIWRNQATSGGTLRKADVEEFKNLSMNPNSASYAVDILTQRSKLVDATSGAAAPASGGYSQAGRPVPYTTATATTIRDRLEALFNTTPAIRVTVGGDRIDVDLQAADVNVPQVSAGGGSAAVLTEYATRLTTILSGALPAGVGVTASFETGPTPIAADGDTSVYLRLTADNPLHDVDVRPAPNARDLAVPMMMGPEQGGLEVSAHALRRPAQNGISLEMRDDANFLALAAAQQGSITSVSLPEQQADGTWSPVAIPVDLVVTSATDPIYRADADAYPNENAGGMALALGTIRDAINDHREANAAVFPWVATVAGNRLNIWPNGSVGDLFSGALTSAGGTNLGALAVQNVKHFVVGPGATQGLQAPNGTGDDGNPPTVAEYEAAFPIIDRNVDLFNLMVIPPTGDPGLVLADVYRPASVFCQQRRAFLIMDAPTDWTTAQQASTSIAGLRIGMVKDHAAVYFPRLQIVEGGRRHFVGPAGAMAGLYARTDGSRGVWKAPAGTEADLRGVTGVEYPLSDAENGFTNPRAINTIRRFPTGVVSWGARTMDGDTDAGSEWKYVPIRRLALMIEESLYRGLQWVVFEPNDEPLWAQIRLNVGAFMHGLFRQGAFQGATKSEAYFVKCDAETTPQADRDLGLVNIWIGFAPLKPAEFVVLYLQQIAGQIET